MPSVLDLLTARLGPLRIDQEKRLPMLTRLITIACLGADSQYRAICAVLYVLEDKRESLELDFPRWQELTAACCDVTTRHWQNARVLDAEQTRVA